MMPDFATFTAAGHVYQLAGRIVPSVTQAMALGGWDPYARVPLRNLERRRVIGTVVHQATHFLDENDLELDSLDQSIVGYVLAWQRFKVEEEFTPLEIERRGISVDEEGGLSFGFCLDRIGMLRDEPALLDIKTPTKISDLMLRCYGIQTAGYARGANFEGKRASVHLREDGTFKLYPHTDTADFSRWDRALATAYDKMAVGIKIPN